jgi:hypothetical protein
VLDATLDPQRNIDAWRGSLEWWVFADGQLGQVVETISGYPGDAWPSSGLQASISTRLSATNRSGSAIMPSVTTSPSPATSTATPRPTLSPTGATP